MIPESLEPRGSQVVTWCFAVYQPPLPERLPFLPQALKGEVQTLARMLDANGSSLSSLTADSLTDVRRLTEQTERCETAIKSLDALCQVSSVVEYRHTLRKEQLLLIWRDLC